MERHLSEAVLERLLARPRGASGEDESAAIAHVARCRRCFRLLGATLSALRRSGKVRVSERGSALVSLIAEEQRHGRRMLQARSGWAALRRQSLDSQRRRLQEVPA